jgi:hypothetical protein
MAPSGARRLGRIGGVLAAVALGAATASPVGAATVAPVHYAGSGNGTITTVKLRSDSVVRWTASGGSFSITLGRQKVSGKAKSGQSFATRGTYRRVVVRARGRWTVTFTALPASRRSTEHDPSARER